MFQPGLSINDSSIPAHLTMANGGQCFRCGCAHIKLVARPPASDTRYIIVMASSNHVGAPTHAPTHVYIHTHGNAPPRRIHEPMCGFFLTRMICQEAAS